MNTIAGSYYNFPFLLMELPMIHVTNLNPCFDLVYKIPELGKETYLDLPAHFFPAGKGLNVAKVIAILGEPVRLLSLMPEDDNSRFETFCDKNNIHFSSYPINGSARINTTVYDELTCSTVHYNSGGPTLSTQVQDGFESFLRGFISKEDQWVFAGSLRSGIESYFYSRLIRACHDHGAFPLLDTRGNALKHGIREHPLVISPNETELESLFQEPIEGIGQLALKGKRLIDSGIDTVFITLGEDGVLALHKDECLLCRPPEIDVVDTVGCGDAFLAGVAVARERGFSFHETCRLAVACGTSNAANFGPAEVNVHEIWHFMEKIFVSQL